MPMLEQPALSPEVLLLQACLHDPAPTWPELEGQLSVDDFDDPDCQALFRWMQSRAAAGEPMDLPALGTTASADLRSAVKKFLVSEPAWLLTTRSLPAYVTQIKEQAQARRLAVFAETLRAHVMAGDPSATVLQFCEEHLRILARCGTYGESVAQADQVAENFEGLDHLERGTPTGLRGWDHKRRGLAGGELLYLAGRPGMGKTALLLTLAEAATVSAPALFVTYELSRRQCFVRQMARAMGLDSGIFRAGMSSTERALAGSVRDDVAAMPIRWIDRPPCTTTAIRAEARRMQSSGGLGMILIDRIELLRDEIPRARNQNEFLGAVSHRLKALAMDLNIPVVCVVQLNREVERRENKRPVLSDLRESGHLEEDADVVWMIYREAYYAPTPENETDAEVLVVKDRNAGLTGTIRCRFWPKTGRFLQATPEPVPVTRRDWQ